MTCTQSTPICTDAEIPPGAFHAVKQVALVLLEMLFGRPPMWYRDITDVGEYIVLCMEIDDPNTPYGGPGGLTGADQQFLRKCLVIEAMDRPMLVQLLQDPAVKAYLGWPEQWGLVRD
jgi:serine/threonine protein kinase